MTAKLEDTMTWPEICEHVLGKIGRTLNRNETAAFRRWFLEREKIGYRFDPVMILRCFRICQELDHKLDHFIVITGREGIGKTTFAFQIGAWCNPSFSLDTVCYGANSYIDVMHRKAESFDLSMEKQEIETLVLDEGTELLSRESLTQSNRVLAKTFFVQRMLGFLVIVNIPNFFMLDSVVRLHRVKTLIEVLDRGSYKCYTGKAIKLVSEFGGRTKDMSSVRVPDGTFWHGSFHKGFPPTIDFNQYQAHKLESIKDMLQGMKDVGDAQKLLSISKISKEVGCGNQTIVNLIKSGKIKGKKIGFKWYVPVEEYEKLMNMGNSGFGGGEQV